MVSGEEEKTSSAPAAQFVSNSSRKGAEDAKDAKEEKKGKGRR